MSTPVQKLFDLKGQHALVTGGSRGLGLQIAEALGEAGAKIMLTSRKASDLEEAVAHLQDKGIDARWIVADASDPAQVHKVCSETLERLGQVDILVNNAGAAWGAPAEDHPLDAWDKVMNLNVRSIFVFSQAIGKASMLPRKKGRIINVASIAGLGGKGGQRPEDERVDRVLAQTPEHDPDHDGRGDHAADQPLDRLRRRDVG